MSHELDTGEERRKAQDWAGEARRHAETAAQSEAAAAAGAEAAAESRENAAASAGLAKAEAERAKEYADGVQTDHAYIEQARQEAQAAAKKAGEAAAKVIEADINGKLAEMQKTAETVKGDAGRAEDAAAGAAMSAADAAGSAAESKAGAEDAKASRDAAKASEAAAEAAADRAEKAVQNVQTAAQGQKGYFADLDALQAAVPAGAAGDWAIVGSTDTVWVWDADTGKWADSGRGSDLSNYYTKNQTDDEIGKAQTAMGQTLTGALAELSDVARTGSYNDLADRPAIPAVPDKLPNPQALTFTGAENTDYDGSSPVSIDIPTVPDKLPNPNKLTFTGTVNAAYDGAEAVEVNISAGGAVILRAEGQAGNHVKAKLGGELVEGSIPESGILQLELPKLGLWEVDTETEDSLYHFRQEVKVYRYGITPCWAIAKKAFADCTPAEIRFVARAGLARDFWQIGDQKKILMETGEEIYVQPYGFDHDFSEDGITKLPLTLGMKDCFNSLHQMNSANTNGGGWASSMLRTGTLPGILESFPKEWRDIMTPCQKKTSIGLQGTTIITTVDTLFLMSEVEFFGAQTYSYYGEGEQYPIFTDGISRLKHSNGVPIGMWARSPQGGSDTGFCTVTENGAASYNPAAASAFGVCAGFCVG